MRGALQSSAFRALLLLLLAAPLGAQPPASDTTTSEIASESESRDAAEPALVLTAALADAVGAGTSHFLVGAIDEAERRQAECLVIELDTPGGLDSAMREIVKRILGADIPVVVYVAPSGARAASAGLWILLAGHVAAMSPGTTTGAAHPVNLGGGGEVDSTMAIKVENDAASYIRSVAQKRGRNAAWAETAVRESASVSSDEALALGVVDRVEPTLQALLESIDGNEVEVLSGARVLRTKNARVEEIEMGWRDRVLSTIANPNVAYLLLMLGSMGLMMEMWNPGAIFPGVVGAISMLLAFFALQVLPVNSVGLLLLALGVVLLILEVKVTSYGMLTIGGVGCLTLGSLLLFEHPDTFYRVSWSVLIPTVALATLFFLFVVSKGLLAQKRRPVTGQQGMIGLVGTADSRIDPQGRVFVHGEYWNARAERPVESGARIEVVGVEGHQLVVRATS
ncbi:MAG: nodulation protein NfeD [Candidatus Latescibacterota bacterium]|nr:MAG: nodulation protein NfeD [Candidatus Latescibacterota bacterium]